MKEPEENDRSWPGHRDRVVSVDPPDIYRAPPYSVEAEQGVLGSIIIKPRYAIAECLKYEVVPEYFYIPAHQTIYEVLLELWKQRQPIDLITFTQALRDRDKLDQVGGASFITSLFTFVPTAANVGYYLEIVISHWQRRMIISAARGAVSAAFEHGADVSAIKTSLWLAMRETESRRNDSLTEHTVIEVTEMVYARQVGATLGIKTGIPGWDSSLRGVFRKRFYAVGARPKVGKSSMIEQAAQTQINDGIPVLILQRDMSLTDMIGRMACRSAGVVFEDYVCGECDSDSLSKVLKAAKQIDPKLLRIFSPANLTGEELVSIVEREIQEYGVRVWYLDLFQRLKTGHRDKVEGLTEAANMIRDVIQTTGVPGVVLAEILKEADKNIRPHSGQFKYCDGLFSSCDTSIMLWSDDDPKKIVIEDGEMRRQKVMFTIDANRGGGVGDEVMYFDRPHMTFYADDGMGDL